MLYLYSDKNLEIMYKSIYRGQEIKVTRVTYEDGKTWWYFQINDSDAEDHLKYKRTALNWAKSLIDERISEGMYPNVKN